MNILDFVLGLNERVLGHANLTKIVASIINDVCKSKSIIETNLEDGNEHKFSLHSSSTSENVECSFCTQIGMRSATFHIRGLEVGHFWESKLDPRNYLTINFNLYEIEESAFNEWKPRKKVEIVNIEHYDGKFTNQLKFYMKNDIYKKGILKDVLKDVEIYVEGGNLENYYPLLSSKGKLFKDAKFNFTMDPWGEIHHMSREKEKSEQDKNYKNFGKKKTENSNTNEQQEKSNTGSKKSKENTDNEQNNKHNSKQEEKQSNNNNYKNESKSEENKQQSDEAPRAKDYFSSTDYYKMLGVSENASTKDIRSAYYSIAAKIHPDVAKEYYLGEAFKKISAIKDVLLDPERRKNYDNYLRECKEQNQNN